MLQGADWGGRSPGNAAIDETYLCRRLVQSFPFPNISCPAVGAELPRDTLNICNSGRPGTLGGPRGRKRFEEVSGSPITLVPLALWHFMRSSHSCLSELNGDRLMWCHLLISEVLYCYRYTHVRDSSVSQLLSLPDILFTGWWTKSPFLSLAAFRAVLATILYLLLPLRH